MEFNKEEIIKFYTQNKVVIFPVLAGISSLLIIMLVIYPTLSGFLSGNQKLKDLHRQSQALAAKATELANLDQTALTSNLTVSTLALPTDQDYASAIGTVQALSSAAAYTITSVQIIPNLPAGFSSKIPGFTLKVEILGPRATLNTYLSALESSLRVMRVAGFEVNPAKTGDTINVVVNLAVFYSPHPSSLGSADTPLPQITNEEKTVIANLARANSIINQSQGLPAGPSSTTKGKLDPFE